MLQAGNGGDGSVMIPFVSTSEWPTPVHAIFRAGTRSAVAKNPQRDISQLTNCTDYAGSANCQADGVKWSLSKMIMVPIVCRRHALKVAALKQN